MIKGAAHFYQRKGKHIIIPRLSTGRWICRQLSEGLRYWFEPNEDGLTTPEMIAAAMREDTPVVSVMHANNEITGNNDIAGIGEVCRERGVTTRRCCSEHG